MHACMHTYVHADLHIHARTYTYKHIRTHTYTYTCIHTYVHTYMRTCIHKHTYYTHIDDIHVHVHVHIHIHIYRHTYKHTYLPTYLPAYVRTHAHMYIRTCTYSRVLTGSPGMDDRPIRDGRKLSVHVGLLAKPSALCGGRAQTQNPKKNRVQNPRPLKNSPSFDCSMTGLCTATQVATQAWVRVFGVGL